MGGFFMVEDQKACPSFGKKKKGDVIMERKDKSISASETESKISTIFGNGFKTPKCPGVVGYEFDPETGDFKPRPKRKSPTTSFKKVRSVPF